jgi:hypothetical protein
VHDHDHQLRHQRSTDLPRSGAREIATDLSSLTGNDLLEEVLREDLRDRRQERLLRATSARRLRARQTLELRLEIALVALLLLFAGLASMITAIAGLAGGSENVRSGLVALCAVSGGILYRLRRARPERGQVEAVGTGGSARVQG